MQAGIKILFSLMAYIVVLSSILQFHHHDCYGNVSLFSISENDYVMVNDFGINNTHSHEHSTCCECNSRKSDEEHNCGMQLSVSNIARDNTDNMPTIGAVFLLLYEIFDIEAQNESLESQYYPPIKIPLLFLSSFGLRAPPFYIIS